LLLILAALAVIAFILSLVNTWIIILVEVNAYKEEYNTTTGCPYNGICQNPLKCHYGNVKDCYIYGFATFVTECLFFCVGLSIFYYIRKHCTEYDKLCHTLSGSSSVTHEKDVEHTE
jgi:hypothetical protein